MMVRQLLSPLPSKQEPSELELREVQQAFETGFYDAAYDLAHWTALGDVSPKEAAALFCGINPLNEKHHAVGKDYLMLERRFSDHMNNHSVKLRLAEWWELACTWKKAGHLNGITLDSEFGVALALLNAQHLPSAGQLLQSESKNQTTNETAPVMTESAPPMDGITTAQVAAAFYDIQYTSENWIKRLSDMKWLKPANLGLGAAGGGSSLWCPLKLAKLIHGKVQKPLERQKRLEALNKRFKNKPILKAWRDDWNEHYEMFRDTD